MKRSLIASILGSCLISPNVFAEVIDLKMWMRSDQNLSQIEPTVSKAAESLNKELESEGDKRRVNVDMQLNRARGWDEDVLQYLRSNSVNRGADIYIGAHEWIASLAESDAVIPLDEDIEANPQLFGDMVDWIWPTVTYKQQRWGIPFLPEARMVFFNKQMLRDIGKSDEYIESLSGKVDDGEFTIHDLSALTKEVIDNSDVKYGMLHRPNTGPDFLMNMRSFGFEPQDPVTGNLVVDQKALEEFLAWIETNANDEVTPRNNTSMSWDVVHRAFGEGEAFAKIHGIWGVPNMINMGISDDTEESYFENVGWMNVPSAVKGEKPYNMTHPLMMTVSPTASDKELSIRLIGEIIKSENYTPLATGAGFLAIHNEEQKSDAYQEAWISRSGSELLASSEVLVMPIHPSLAKYNDILFRGIQAVETGRLSSVAGTEFIVERMNIEMSEDVTFK